MTYILAVSGGIDSVVLLDIIMNVSNMFISQPSTGTPRQLQGEERCVEFISEHQAEGQAPPNVIVAHVDHGMRDDSAEDEKFVRQLAEQYHVGYVSTGLQLGAAASEDTARRARYEWLEHVRRDHHAEAIVTAHHQDDVIETMVINIIRGTGWRGVCALRDHERVRRPLLGMSKAEIVRYAIDHGLLWRDDETNDNPRYLRNAIRQIIMRRLTPAQRAAWVRLYDAQRHVSAGIAEASRAVAPLAIHDGELSRYYISMVDRSVAHELITLWCGQRLESRARDRLWHFACTALPGKRTHERGLSIVAARRGIRIVSPSDIC